MIDLVRFFRNPFVDRRISLSKLVIFAGQHLARMVVMNPGGVFDERIAATTDALAAFRGTNVDNCITFGLRKGFVLAKETFRALLHEKLARIHGAVVVAYGAKAPELTECFPKGRTVFTTCVDEELASELKALHAGLVKYSAQVGASAVDEAAELISTWQALLDEVRESSAGKRTTEAGRRAARAVLQRELFRNLLALAQHFLGEEDKAAQYCPQYLLERGAHGMDPDALAA